MTELGIDLDVARKELEDHLGRLASELGALQKLREAARHGKDEHAGYGNHVAEAATETFEAERDLALIENLKQVQEHCRQALQRIDEGTYGQCTSCNQPIPRERLEALPFAGQCVACKSREQAH